MDAEEALNNMDGAEFENRNMKISFALKKIGKKKREKILKEQEEMLTKKEEKLKK